MQQQQSYFRSLQILFFALLGGQVLFLTMFWFLQQADRPAAQFLEDFWLQAIAVFALIAVGMSMFLSKKFIQNARNQSDLQKKLAAYRFALILSWALAEAATLINGVFYFMSGRLEFLYLAIGVIGFFITLMPRKDKAIADLELNTSEAAELDAKP